MNNFFEELKKYFEVTPQEKILEDWAKSAEFDNIGPSVDEFLQNAQCYYVFSNEPNDSSIQNTINNYSPKFSSGFFLTNNSQNYAKGCVFYN